MAYWSTRSKPAQTFCDSPVTVAPFLFRPMALPMGRKRPSSSFSNVDWPNLYFTVGTGFTNGDWRAWGAVAVDILNTNSVSVTVDIRVDDDFSADGVNHCQTGSASVPGGQTATVVMPLTNNAPLGMRGGPPMAPDAFNMNVYGTAIDLSHIVAFQIFLPIPADKQPCFSIISACCRRRC